MSKWHLYVPEGSMLDSDPWPKICNCEDGRHWGNNSLDLWEVVDYMNQLEEKENTDRSSVP